MTAAFRNFILTLVLSLFVFGYAAYKIMPDVTAVLFGNFEQSDTVSNEESSTDESSDISGEESQPQTETSETEEFEDFNCFIFGKNDVGDICSVLYIRVYEKTGKYVICTIPWNVCLDNSGRLTPLYDLLGSKGAEYSIRKLSALVGVDVPYYIILETKNMQTVAKNLGSAMVELYYEVKFIHPDFQTLPPSQINESHYVKLPQGKTAFTEMYAPYIFNAQQDPDVKDYSMQQSMALSLYKSYFTSTNINRAAIEGLFGEVTTNIPAGNFERYSNLMLTLSGATSAQKVIQMTYPITRDVVQSDLFVPDWNKGINNLLAAEK